MRSGAEAPVSPAALARAGTRPLPWLDRLGPAWCVVLAVTSLGVLPFASTYVIGGRVWSGVVADVDGSALIPAALVCISALGFASMAWSVRTPAARRACIGAGAQTLSHGTALAIAILPLALVQGSLDLVEIAARQDATFTLVDAAVAQGLEAPDTWAAWPGLPRWGVLLNPIAMLLVAVCGLGAMRLPPFDLVAADAEARTALAAEGSGLRLGTAVLGDVANTWVLAGLLVTLGLGGWAIPWLDHATLLGVSTRGLGAGLGTFFGAAAHFVCFALKVGLVFVLLRALGRRLSPVPAERASYLCFRLFLPLALVNVFATGYWLVARPGLG